MVRTYQIRKASSADIPFLVQTIISAKKSNTNKLGLAKLLGCTEKELSGFLHEMLEEEMDGCELSISSFLVAEEADNHPIAAVAGWIEGIDGGLSSSMLKSNLMSFTLPRPALKQLKDHAPILQGLQIPRRPRSLQIEYVYVEQAHRGQQLAKRLIEAHIRQTKNIQSIDLAQVQVFAGNAPAIHAYQKLGFQIHQTFHAADPRATDMLPSNEKHLMQLTLIPND